MRLLNEKNPINVLAKHGNTHDLRINTKVVYGMLIWAFTFLRGARGERASAWENKVFLVFLSILGQSLFKQEGREDLKRDKVRKLTLTPSLMILDSAKNSNLM